MNTTASAATRADAPPTAEPRLGRRAATTIACVALAINLALLATIAVRNPAYLADYRLNANPDAVHYVLLGDNVWSGHGYSRQDGPPWEPDMLRTPIYPLLAGGIQHVFGVIWPLYLLQILFGALTAVVTAMLAARVFGRSAGMLAGLMVASDLTVAGLNFEAMTESLFVLLATGAVLLWTRLAYPGDRARWEGVRGYAGVGVLLALATLTRPAGLYLPVLLGALTLFSASRRRLLSAAVLVLSAYICVAPWVVRNAYLFGVPRLTTVDTINLVYFVGAGVYQVEYGLDRSAAQNRIASDYALTPMRDTYNHWMTRTPVAEIDAKQRRAAWTILRAHPRALIEASAIGVLKASVGHITGGLAQLMGLEWTPPRLSRLAEGRIGDARRSLLSNASVLTGMFVWQLVLNGLMILAALAAALRLLLSKQQRAIGLALMAIIGYHLLTIAMVGIDAYARQRVGATPFVAVLAAGGIVWALSSAHRRFTHV